MKVEARNQNFNPSRDEGNEGGDAGDVVKDEEDYDQDEVDWCKDRNQIVNQRIRRKLAIKILEDGQECNHHNHHKHHHHHHHHL